jgi:predicted nucleotidyltransferase
MLILRKAIMKRNNALALLRTIKPILAQQFGVTQLALFGSTARDEARDNSDLDILVSFDGPATSARYFGVQFYLEDQLGCSVDLVTEKALRPELRPFIEKEAINV